MSAKDRITCVVLFLAPLLFYCSALQDHERSHRILKRDLSSKTKPSSWQEKGKRGAPSNHDKSDSDAPALFSSNENDDDGESLILQGLFEDAHKNSPIYAQMLKTEDKEDVPHPLKESSSLTQTFEEQVQDGTTTTTTTTTTTAKPRPKKRTHPVRNVPASDPSVPPGEYCLGLGKKCRKHKECCEMHCNWRTMKCDYAVN